MSTSSEIESVCREIKSAGFPIEIGYRDGTALFLTDQEGFGPLCSQILEQGREYQSHYLKVSPSLWTAPIIRTVADFLRQHHLQGIMLGPNHPTGMEGLSFSVFEGRIQLGLFAVVSHSERFLRFKLRHEVSHLSDWALLIKQSPEVGRFKTTGYGTREDAIKMIETYLALAKKMMPEEKQKTFDRDVATVLGDIRALPSEELPALITLLGELLRFAEEVHVPTYGEYVLTPEFPFFKKGHKIIEETRHDPNLSKRIKRELNFFAAAVQEAGRWEELKQLPSFDPGAEKMIDPQEVAFFRSMIRAFGRYFYLVLR